MGKLLAGFAILLVVVVAVAVISESKKTPEEQARDEVACRADLQCWSDRARIYGSFDCERRIERLGRFESKWTDSTFERKFSRARWLDQARGTVTLIGDKISFQNGFGAWLPHVYTCDVDPATKTVLAVDAFPGRLP